jgi:(E)-4-hydroxy-3-methylbut-2-enyl-diphosphate synthase
LKSGQAKVEALEARLPDRRDPFHYVPRPTYEVASGAVKAGGIQPVAVVASVGPKVSWPDGDLYSAVANLAKRKGQNALRPDLIRVPLQGLDRLDTIVEELKRRSEEEDPSAGKSALALLVDAGSDFVGAARAARNLEGVGGIRLTLATQDPAPDWRAFEDCVKAAIEPHVPLWLEAHDDTPAEVLLAQVMSGIESVPAVDLALEMASRAHALGHRGLVLSITTNDSVPSYLVRAYRLLSSQLTEAGRKYPLHIDDYAQERGEAQEGKHTDTWLIEPSVVIGSLLCDGIGNSVEVAGEGASEDQVALAYNILQAAGTRTVKAEFVACPSCGRTLFDLQETTERIKLATGHLRGVKIAVMGCIVNGLGELADADFGYMGGAPGKVNLFVGKECVEKGVPTEQAVDRLIGIIKDHDKWTEPAAKREA